MATEEEGSHKTSTRIKLLEDIEEGKVISIETLRKMRDDKDILNKFDVDLSSHERRLVYQGTESGRWSGTTPPISEINRMIAASQKLKHASPYHMVTFDKSEITNLKWDWFMYGFAAALAQALVAFIVYVEHLK